MISDVTHITEDDFRPSHQPGFNLNDLVKQNAIKFTKSIWHEQ